MMTNDPENWLEGAAVFSYTRQQAIADGVLHPIHNDWASDCGFRGEMVFGSDLMARVIGETWKDPALLGLPRRSGEIEALAFRKYAYQVMCAANEAICSVGDEATHSAGDRDIGRVAFDWHGPAIIHVAKNNAGVVEWTIMTPSDD